jgi:hypothetical protein
VSSSKINDDSKGVVMKKLMLMLVSMVALSSGIASARGSSGGGYLTGLNLYYYTQNEEAAMPTATTTKSADTYIDLNLGYIMSNGLYFGLLYFTDSTDHNGARTTGYSGYGPSIGWMFNSGWMIKAHYVLDSTDDKYSTTLDKWTKGTGLQLDVGYMFPVSSTFHLGAQLVYKSIKFTNYNDGTTDFTTYSYTKTETLPQITMAFVF